eukprot:g27906.t1
MGGSNQRAIGGDDGKAVDDKLTVMLEGHRDYVDACCFSPDGRLALSGSSDGMLRLWDVSQPADFKLLATLKGHTDYVNACCCFSVDGRLALSGSGDRTLRLWDVSQPAETKLLATLEGHTDYVNACCFSPDVRLALSGSYDKTLRLWDVSQPAEIKLLATRKGNTDYVNACCFSPDGRLALSGSGDTKLRLWDVSQPADLKLLATLKGHTKHVKAWCFSPDGRLALNGSGDTTLRLWDVSQPADLKLLATLKGHTKHVKAWCFSPDGRLALNGSGDTTLRLWDVSQPADLKLLATLKGHTKHVKAWCFSPDGRLALNGSGDTTLRLWRVVEWVQPDSFSPLQERANPYPRFHNQGREQGLTSDLVNRLRAKYPFHCVVPQALARRRSANGWQRFGGDDYISLNLSTWKSPSDAAQLKYGTVGQHQSDLDRLKETPHSVIVVDEVAACTNFSAYGLPHWSSFSKRNQEQIPVGQAVFLFATNHGMEVCKMGDGFWIRDDLDKELKLKQICLEALHGKKALMDRFNVGFLALAPLRLDESVQMARQIFEEAQAWAWEEKGVVFHWSAAAELDVARKAMDSLRALSPKGLSPLDRLKTSILQQLDGKKQDMYLGRWAPATQDPSDFKHFDIKLASSNNGQTQSSGGDADKGDLCNSSKNSEPIDGSINKASHDADEKKEVITSVQQSIRAMPQNHHMPQRKQQEEQQQEQQKEEQKGDQREELKQIQRQQKAEQKRQQEREREQQEQ